MKLAEARKIAEWVRDELMPYCARIEIAGSIRRQRPEIGDIEIVAIPKTTDTGLFAGYDAIVDPGFCAIVNRWPAVKGKPTGKYTQRILPDGIILDLFIARPENWGAIFLIRTGDLWYSKKFMGTILPSHGYRMCNGYVTQNGKRVSVPEEIDLYRITETPYCRPEERSSLL